MSKQAEELINKVIDCVNEDEVVKFAGDICKIPSPTMEETPLSR